MSNASMRTVVVEDGYEGLLDVLLSAYDQAARGKGLERHGADGLAFEGQPIFWIAEAFGEGFLLGQAVKKLHESRRLGPEAAAAELRGAIVYVAAQILRLEEMR